MKHPNEHKSLKRELNMLFERLRMAGKNSRGCSNAGHEVESTRTRHLCLSRVPLSFLLNFLCPSCSSSFVSLKFLCPSCLSFFAPLKLLCLSQVLLSFLSSFAPPPQVLTYIRQDRVCSETIMLQKSRAFALLPPN